MSTIFERSSFNELISPSLGACKTITVEPMTVRAHPILPIVLSFSSKKYAAMIALIRTLKAPFIFFYKIKIKNQIST
jgi:hypothetical protein